MCNNLLLGIDVSCELKLGSFEISGSPQYPIIIMSFAISQRVTKVNKGVSCGSHLPEDQEKQSTSLLIFCKQKPNYKNPPNCTHHSHNLPHSLIQAFSQTPWFQTFPLTTSYGQSTTAIPRCSAAALGLLGLRNSPPITVSFPNLGRLWKLGINYTLHPCTFA